MGEIADNRTCRLTHALPPCLTREGEVLHLKEGWFTGCKPVAYIFSPLDFSSFGPELILAA